MMSELPPLTIQRKVRRIRDLLRSVNTDEELSKINELLDDLESGKKTEKPSTRLKAIHKTGSQAGCRVISEEGDEVLVVGDHVAPSDINPDGTVSFPLDGCPTGGCNPN